MKRRMFLQAVAGLPLFGGLVGKASKAEKPLKIEKPGMIVIETSNWWWINRVWKDNRLKWYVWNWHSEQCRRSKYPNVFFGFVRNEELFLAEQLCQDDHRRRNVKLRSVLTGAQRQCLIERIRELRVERTVASLDDRVIIDGMLEDCKIGERFKCNEVSKLRCGMMMDHLKEKGYPANASTTFIIVNC